jgi:hypothetical protein
MMFGWFKSREEKEREKKQEQKEYDEHIEKCKEAQENHYNFQEEDGVQCIFHKVLEDIEHNFGEWVFVCGEYIHDNIKISVSYRESRYDRKTNYYYGNIQIDNAIFNINNKTCKVFLDKCGKVKDNFKQQEKERVLKEWGCK